MILNAALMPAHRAGRGHEGGNLSVQDTYLWPKEDKYTGNCIALSLHSKSKQTNNNKDIH